MGTKYVILNWRFNFQAWASVIEKWRNEAGDELVAAACGCDVTTLSTWVGLSDKREFPYPSMARFIAAVNALDLNPADFFELEVE